jgi:hypothetical protein
MAIEISPMQFAAQWVDVPHQMIVNMHNFTVLGSKKALKAFQQSFKDEKFNSKGATRWHTTVPHNPTILRETGALYKSLSVIDNTLTRSGRGWRAAGGVFSDPKVVKSKGKRIKRYSYASIHNDYDTMPARTKRYGGPKYERKFLGDSTVVKDELDELITPVLFMGIPK